MANACGERLKRLLQEIGVVLCHEDVPVDVTHRRLNGERNVLANIHLPRYRQAGVSMAVMAAGGDQTRPICRPEAGFPTYMEGALHSLIQLYAEERESEGQIRIVTSVSDLDEIRPGGPFGMLLHLEGAKPLAGQLSMVEVFYRLGVRSMQLVWYGRNELADSTGEKRPGGLTKFGVSVVKAMNELGMVIDLSHMAEPSFFDVIEASSQPVIASHSNARALVDHPRNLTDEQIKAVAATGGLVGVVFFPTFVKKEAPTLEDILDQIDYLKGLIGIDHIGIGPDFVDYAPELILGNVTAAGADFDWKFPRDAEDVTKIPNLIRGLIERGYSDEEITKIMRDNFFRVLRQVLKN